jgi:hypothetical protein
MIKKTFFILLTFLGFAGFAQDNTASPYSFFGVGTNKFSGTVENRVMGGLGIKSDSIHINLQNPAGYAGLGLTTFSVGASHTSNTISDNISESKVTATGLDYVALAFPAGKFGFGFGLKPFSSVGYEMGDFTEDREASFSGSGGVNKLYLGAAYQVLPELSVGVEGGYYFGNIKNKSILRQQNVQFGTREKNRSDLSGFRFNFGTHYEKMLTDKLQLTASATYAPASTLNAKNERQLATIVLNLGDDELVAEEREVAVADSELDLGAVSSFGAGIGQPRKWFAGFEYQITEANKFSNRSYSLNNVAFNTAHSYKLGGYYTPNFNDVTGYFKRVTYRAGLRYEELGLAINQESIDEFGISFGVGLPAGDFLTNINLGVEYGQRGTTKNNLVEEKFFSFFVGLSLNDKWFIKRKYN